MRLINRVQHDERGASLVLVAITMVVLLGFTALVVDLGQGYNERRLSQTSADAAVLGGIQHIGVNRTVATAEAMEIARQNLRITYTDAEWTALWAASAAPGNGCPSTKPTAYNFPPGSPPVTKCVLFNDAGTRMRVHIPDQIMETVFGKVLGQDDLRAAADAEAEIAFGGMGGVLPFGILSNSGGGSEACLKSTSNGTADGTAPCSGSSNGNFGSLDAPLYGGDTYGTTPKCNGDTNGRLVSNMVTGIDHRLDEYQETAGPSDTVATAGPNEPERRDGCWLDGPNTLRTQTGIGSNLDEGLVRTDNAPYVGGVARLRRGSNPKTTVTTKELDNKPLWEYLDDSIDTTGMPDCDKSSYNNPTTKTKARLNLCFAQYEAKVAAGDAVPELFTEDVVNSPRLVFIPEFHENSFGTGTEWLRIRRFRAAFIQTLYFSCSNDVCDVTFNPGEDGVGLPGAGNKRVDAMTAMIFRDSMLPDSVLESGPGGTLNGAEIGLIQ